MRRYEIGQAPQEEFDRRAAALMGAMDDIDDPVMAFQLAALAGGLYLARCPAEALDEMRELLTKQSDRMRARFIARWADA